MVNYEAKSNFQARNNLIQEYSSSQPHLIRLKLDGLRLVCSTKYFLGFKEGRRMGIHTSICLQRKDLQISTLPGNADTEGQDKKYGL
ncbi:hypothetical protein DPMN_107226 [Dreissena polymorpha]|uniref:Uncharacterized protein n=1 Tax=Dreissena polymorpha TaxID=45954 RepID=A0A9D4QKQ3_DREPO|nr:hypothetical protein DPMN_107226 [Dreissena polymorpha]